MTIERLLMFYPDCVPLAHRSRLEKVERTLKIACVVFGVAGECYLWPPSFQNVNDLDIGNIAHLVILLDHFSILVANTTRVLWHQRIAGSVLCANIAVDTCPSIRAFAIVAFAHRPIESISERSADYIVSAYRYFILDIIIRTWSQAIISPKTRRA